MLKHRYFVFEEGIRWFKAVGSSPSNSWIGSARLIDTVHQPSRIESGDTLHVLLGGTFLVRADGSVESGRLRLRKPAFEKTYGIHLSDERICERMAECGRCREVPKPEGDFAYNAAREAASKNTMAERIGQVLRNDDVHVRSPLLQDIFAACYSADLGSAVAAAGGKWAYADVGMGLEPDSLECLVRVELPDGKRISIAADPMSREVWIRDDTRSLGPALREGGAEGFEIEPEYRNELVTIVHEDQLYATVEAIAEFVRGGCTFGAAKNADPA